MLRLYPSNKTESLASVMAALMKAQPLSDPLQAELILIQSHGMGTWLRQSLSAELGIAAQIDAQMPFSFVWQLASKLLPDAAVSPLFEKANLRWEIYRRLPSLLAREEFAPLKRYLAALKPDGKAQADSQSVALDLFKLSEALADSFDGYQNYRSDWIEAWEQQGLCLQGEAAHVAQLERWQAELWRALYVNESSAGVEPDENELAQRLHRPRQLSALKARLQAGDIDKSLLPERLFIFGLSALPPQWLELFLLLGRYIDIHFLVQNPCRYYWGDVQTEAQRLRWQQSLLAQGIAAETIEDADALLENNALLASWGKLGRDYIASLYQYDESQGLEEFSASLFDDWHAAKGEASSALRAIQQDILDLNSRQHVLALSDQSMRFASCHSRLRELEALKDYLLDALSQDPSLALKDIIVMMPNVQDYAPLIEAVFGEGCSTVASGAPEREQYLRFAISDQSARHDYDIAELLLALLELSKQPLSSTQVLDWLMLDALRARFELSETEFGYIAHWLELLNVRWGLSAEHRAQVLGLNSGGSGDNAAKPNHNSYHNSYHNRGNTWLRAAQRLLAGHVYGAQLAPVDDDVLPAALSSGEAQIALSKLLKFLALLEVSVERLGSAQASLSVPESLQNLRLLWQHWVDEEVLSPSFNQQFEQVLDGIELQCLVTAMNDAVPFNVVAKCVAAEFERERVSQRFLAGRINFCTLMPMRSIPFKVVCLLGMNEGEYPRPSQQSSFDLMASSAARRGDRSRRDDDRYLFLEALLSVRERLYISYVGRSAHDNSERFPSLLVSELRDYLLQYARPDELANDGEVLLKAWTYEHRLQAFHAAYFAKGFTSSFQSGQASDSNTSTLPQSFHPHWLALFGAEADEQSYQSESDDKAKPEPEPNAEQSAEKGAEKGAEQVIEHLSLTRLSQALLKPLAYYYQSMGVQEQGLDEVLEQQEPFDLNGLEKFALRQSVLAMQAQLGSDDAGSAEASFERLAEQWRVADFLPQAPFDGPFLAQAKDAASELSAALPGGEALSQSDLVLMLDGCQITARMVHQGGSLQRVNLSGSPALALQRLWLEHVFWHCFLYQSEQGYRPKMSVLHQQDSQWQLPVLSQEQAFAYARALLADFHRLPTQPHCYLAKTAFAQLFQTAAKAQGAFVGVASAGFSQAGEQDDFYWQRFVQLSGYEVDYDEQGLPVMDGYALLEQLRAHHAEIKEQKS